MAVSKDLEKQRAGEHAARYVEDGMVVGLGTGSTVYYTTKKIAERVNYEGLSLQFVSTSKRTMELAQSLGLWVRDLDEVPEIDLTIDGVDEFDPDLNGIKGGGGAHLFEKIVATSSKVNIWVADSAKEVPVLGGFPLPVEVLPFGSRHTFKKLEDQGLRPEFRKGPGDAFVLTDSQNLIIDLKLEKIEDPEGLSQWLNAIPGVVENGLFLKIADRVVIANEAGVVRVIERK
jgi:ribose 5-phosphate isomerase A